MPWVTAIRPALAPTRATHPPRESWWCCPEEDFTAKAADELQRMKLSKFGSIQLGTSEADAKIARRRLLPT